MEAVNARRGRAGLGALVFAVGACASAPPPSAHASRPAPAAAAAPPVAAAPPTAAAPVAPPPPWLADIEAELEALRGLAFQRQVRFGTQSRDSYRLDVRAQIARELPPAKGADLSRAYQAMGYARPGFDLARALEEAVSTQVAAYYDPHTRAFKVIDRGPDRQDSVVAHELAHALQDQHFDLAAFQPDSEAEQRRLDLDDDHLLARRFVVEGEATFLMMARGLGSGAAGGMRLGPLAVAGLRMNLTMLAAADMLDLLANMRQGRSADRLDPETRSELEALARLPPLVTLPLIEPYLKGALFVSEVWARGGWSAVDALYAHPPASSEQVLHPLEKFLPARDPPLRVRLAVDPPPVLAAAHARLLSSEVIGELGWRIYFKTWQYPAVEQAAAGWGGDRYWAWERGGGMVTLTATRWDSDEDARRFFAAYQVTLASRFPSAGHAATLARDEIEVLAPEGRVLVLERRGRDVDVIDGATSAERPALEMALRAATRAPEQAR
jgi:hypothetical protein